VGTGIGRGIGAGIGTGIGYRYRSKLECEGEGHEAEAGAAAYMGVHPYWLVAAVLVMTCFGVVNMFDASVTMIGIV